MICMKNQPYTAVVVVCVQCVISYCTESVVWYGVLCSFFSEFVACVLKTGGHTARTYISYIYITFGC